MKTLPLVLLEASLALGTSLLAAEPATNAPGPAEPAASKPAGPPGRGEQPPPALSPALASLAKTDASNGPPAGVASTNAGVGEITATNALSLSPSNASYDGLHLNFRSAPLELVLNYLSDAAGFIIVLDTDVRGKVDVWSNQPVTKEEAVNLLNSVLNKNGYAAVRDGRTLTIVARDAAKSRNIPVKKGNEPEQIPKNDEIVTQIIPMRYISATQVTKDLQPLLPMAATMTANDSGNAVLITDTQANIRRMAEIIKALDTSVSVQSEVRVYPLKHADAKTAATVIKDLFQSQDSGQQNANAMRAQFFQRMGGGRGNPFGGGGSFGGGGADTGSGAGAGRVPQPKVLATSDDRSNALIVSAPEDLISTIDELVKAIDINVEDVTEVRVFKLKYADPVEMADLLSGLFPDDTRSDSANMRNNVRFGGGPFGGGFFGGGRGNTANSQESERTKKMGRVLAVADQRTASVVVSAAHDLMVQIAQMIEQLDENPAKKKKVYVYSLENADAQEVEQILRNMFDRSGTMNSRNTSTQNNPLTTRSSQAAQQNTGIGTTGTGTSRGVSGGTGVGGGF